MPHPAPAHKSFADRNSLYQQITGKIIAELEQGRVPWVQPWANVKAPLGLPKNATTGRAYSGVNVLILWIACMERGFGTQSWLTFRQALKAGGHEGRKGHAARLCRPLHSLPRAHDATHLKLPLNNRSENAQPAILELVGIVYEDIEFEERIVYCRSARIWRSAL